MSRFTWSNNPISQKLREQIEEATNVKRSFTDGGRTVSEKIDSVSQKILADDETHCVCLRTGKRD